MARSLPTYKPLNPRSLDPYGIGQMLLNDNYNPIAEMDARFKEQIAVDEAAAKQADREQRDEIEKQLAEMGAGGAPLEDVLARAEQEYLSRGDFAGAVGIRDAKQKLEPDVLEEARRLSGVINAANSLGAIDPNAARDYYNMNRLPNLPEVSGTPFGKPVRQYVPGKGEVDIYPDGRTVWVRPERAGAEDKPDYLRTGEYAKAEQDILMLSDNPMQYQAYLESLPPQVRKVIEAKNATPAPSQSAISETGQRRKKTVEEAQAAARARFGREYDERGLQRLREQGLVE